MIVVDLRGMPDILAHNKGRKDQPRPPFRAPTDLGHDAAILVHQTGVAGISATGDWVENYGARAREHRMRSWVYHVVAFGDGVVAVAHSAVRYTYHANQANRFAVAVAIEGLYPRTEREREARHSDLTDEGAEAGALAISLARDMLADLGVKSPCIITHRQSSDQRGADPGEVVMQRIVKPAAAFLSIPIAHDYTIGSGRPTPEEWR